MVHVPLVAIWAAGVETNVIICFLIFLQRERHCNDQALQRYVTTNGATGQNVAMGRNIAMGPTIAVRKAIAVVCPLALQRKNIATHVATIHRFVAINVAMGVAMSYHHERCTKSLR